MRKFWNKKKKEEESVTGLAAAAREYRNPFSEVGNYLPLADADRRLYEALREGVPLIDSAIQKTVRLTGGFSVECSDQRAQTMLERFLQEVKVGGSGLGMENFLAAYLDSLLTYGNAAGEILLSRRQESFLGLYVADASLLTLKQGKNPLEVEFFTTGKHGELKRVANRNFILFTALNPKPGELRGESVLRSLPFVTNILFKIYHSIGQNFDRIGNIRYAVSYHPSTDPSERAFAKERTELIAREWSEGMSCGADGPVRDFITMGDVSIKVIGAENQMIDTDVPVRQMLEQIVAKLSIPPFLLGLNWSTTERMSKQQTDILTTELEYYRRLLNPVILKICRTFLAVNGMYPELKVNWNTINLKDEVEAAQARLYLAQAEQIERGMMT